MASPEHTILVADADASFRSFLGGLLRPRDLEVLEARGLWDVWPLLDSHRIDLFVVDAQLPDEGGLALVTELRNRGIVAPILFVASQWQGVEAHGRLTTKLGVQRVLHKPFSAYQFISEVESTLSAPSLTISNVMARPPAAEDPLPRRIISEPMMAAIDVAPPSSSTGASTLVVVGEDASLRAALEAAATDAVVSLTHAADAEEATRLISRRRLAGALVLLDHDDPDAGFAEATELLCSDLGKGFPVGFVSQSSDVGTRVNAIQAGGVVHLTPPFRAHDIQQAADAMAHLRRERKTRVVVVADAVRGVELGGVLRNAGMKVFAISDAYTLLDHLSATTPDVILFDIDLPGVSGLDVCKLLRASPSWRALALMLVATHGSSEARIAAFDAGADDYLIKPLDEEELVARVEARVRRHRAVRESADKDPISGLLQRHALVERARATLAAARRNADPVAFCVLQLENFTALREQHDALTSERAMVEAGRLIASLLREYDLRARWSESELLLVLVDMDVSSAAKLSQRLAAGVHALDVRNGDGQQVSLSFRLGVAAHPDDAHSIPALVRGARKRLAALPTPV